MHDTLMVDPWHYPFRKSHITVQYRVNPNKSTADVKNNRKYHFISWDRLTASMQHVNNRADWGQGERTNETEHPVPSVQFSSKSKSALKKIINLKMSSI